MPGFYPVFMKSVNHNRAEEYLIHPDMIGLITDDFNEI